MFTGHYQLATKLPFVILLLNTTINIIAGSTSSESFDEDNNEIRHSTNSERSPEAGSSRYDTSYINSNNQTNENNTSDRKEDENDENDDDDDR